MPAPSLRFPSSVHAGCCGLTVSNGYRHDGSLRFYLFFFSQFLSDPTTIITSRLCRVVWRCRNARRRFVRLLRLRSRLRSSPSPPSPSWPSCIPRCHGRHLTPIVTYRSKAIPLGQSERSRQEGLWRSSSGDDDDRGSGGDGVLFILRWDGRGCYRCCFRCRCCRCCLWRLVLLPAATVVGVRRAHGAQGQCRPISVSGKVSVGYSCRIIFPSCARSVFIARSFRSTLSLSCFFPPISSSFRLPWSFTIYVLFQLVNSN